MRSDAVNLLAACAALMLVGGCNKSPQSPVATSEAEARASSAEADAAATAAATREKEAELARREAQLAAREADLAAAASQSRKPPSTPRPATSKPAAVSPTLSAPAPPAATPPVAIPAIVVVPSGTQLSLTLATPLSSKTARVGDTVRANLTQDVRVGDRLAISAGTTIAGSVTDVVSGSNKIGGVPTLGLRFERLELPGNVDVPIDGVLTQKGKSDTGRDTAKIVGGAAAGAILGHQVKGGDKGKVLGGLLGGAIGAVAAQKTGTEVTLAEGTEFSIALAAPVEITKR
jgi:hypothetical protein